MSNIWGTEWQDMSPKDHGSSTPLALAVVAHVASFLDFCLCAHISSPESPYSWPHLILGVFNAALHFLLLRAEHRTSDIATYCLASQIFL